MLTHVYFLVEASLKGRNFFRIRVSHRQRFRVVRRSTSSFLLGLCPVVLLNLRERVVVISTLLVHLMLLRDCFTTDRAACTPTGKSRSRLLVTHRCPQTTCCSSIRCNQTSLLSRDPCDCCLRATTRTNSYRFIQVQRQDTFAYSIDLSFFKTLIAFCTVSDSAPLA